MAASLTEQEFSKHLNTNFLVSIPEPVTLELIEVKPYSSKELEQGGMERFSLYFIGPADHYLSQATYSLEHQRMGGFELFLVPVARDERGFQYEAVFNYYKDQSDG